MHMQAWGPQEAAWEAVCTWPVGRARAISGVPKASASAGLAAVSPRGVPSGHLSWQALSRGTGQALAQLRAKEGRDPLKAP